MENDFVKMGAFHTVDIALQRCVTAPTFATVSLFLVSQFTLHKTEWDEIALERLEEATDVVKRAEVRVYAFFQSQIVI